MVDAERLRVAARALTEARGIDRERIWTTIADRRVVGVYGEAETGKTSVIEAGLRGERVARVDLDGAAGEAEVAWLLARALARFVALPLDLSLLHAPSDLQPARAKRVLVQLTETLGATVRDLALAEGPDRASADLDEVLDHFDRLADSDTILWIDHLETPSLTPRHPVDVDSLLWRIRARGQRSEWRLLLSCRTPAVEIAASERGAYYLDGEWLRLVRPDRAIWRRVASQAGAPMGPELDPLLDLTQGHPRTTLLVLASTQDDRSAHEAFADLISLDTGLAARAMQHAKTLHRLGGHVLTEVAAGRGPYQRLARYAATKDISLAVSRLHMAGLLTQPAPRKWLITNPLVAACLRGGLPREPEEEPENSDTPLQTPFAFR